MANIVDCDEAGVELDNSPMAEPGVQGAGLAGPMQMVDPSCGVFEATCIWTLQLGAFWLEARMLLHQCFASEIDWDRGMH
jgi:hypothetical protein